MVDRIEFLTTNFPKYVAPPDEFKNLHFEENIHIICKNLPYRKIAKRVAIHLVYDYLQNPTIKFPPFYLTKDLFLSEWRLFINGFDSQISRWQKASILVFDGFDETASQRELSYISNFIVPLMGKIPLILISAGNLTEDVLKKFNALSFGVQLCEIKELCIGE